MTKELLLDVFLIKYDIREGDSKKEDRFKVVSMIRGRMRPQVLELIQHRGGLTNVRSPVPVEVANKPKRFNLHDIWVRCLPRISEWDN